MNDAETRGEEAMNMSRELPFYVERGGDIVIRQPLLLREVTTYSFVLSADIRRLAALIDRSLNAPAGGTVRYIPAGPFVALVCADIGHSQAVEEPDRSKGWMAEKDVAFWIPLWAGKQVGPLFVPERLVFFLPYVFVDNIAAAVTGRETYGFPKESGILRFPAGPGAEGGFAIDTLIIRAYGASARGDIARLIDIEPAEPEAPPPEADVWADLETGLGALGDRLKGLIHTDAIEAAAGAAVEAFRAALRPGARLVFLKQFRDAEDPARACYQAIIEAPASVKTLHNGGWLPKHRVRIAMADSHPIVEELGLSGAVSESIFGSWLRFDFTMERGKVVWSATA
jgi:hypothetical protein